MSEKILDVFLLYEFHIYASIFLSNTNIHIIYIYMPTESCAVRDEVLMTILQCKRQILLSGFLWYTCFWNECQEIYEMKNNLITISHGIL